MSLTFGIGDAWDHFEPRSGAPRLTGITWNVRILNPDERPEFMWR